MSATVETVGLAEWIIDDTCLVYVVLVQHNWIYLNFWNLLTCYNRIYFTELQHMRHSLCSRKKYFYSLMNIATNA